MPSLYGIFYQNVHDVTGKRSFDQVVLTINSDAKPSCRTNVLLLFN